jgi:hypothetical protein
MLRAEALLLGYKILRSELIPVNDQPALIAIIAHLASDHFHGHTDLNFGIIHIGQLSGDHGSFFEFDKGYGIRGVGFITSGSFIDRSIGIHFTFAAEGEKVFGFVAAVRADIARGEDLVIAVRADLTNETISLFFKTPVSRDFHIRDSFR